MSETKKDFWAQPDVDIPGWWVVCKNPDSARIVAMGFTKADAEAMAERLNTPMSQPR